MHVAAIIDRHPYPKSYSNIWRCVIWRLLIAGTPVYNNIYLPEISFILYVLYMHQKKFHRKRNRLQWYDYSSSWAYFVTICTFEMKCIFGEIIEDEMMCNQYGKIAEKYRHEIVNIYPSVELDAYIVMPNHIHGIIILPPWWTTNLSTIIKWYKRACTKEIRKTIPDFARHRTYYDNIIRNQKMYDTIVQYMVENPMRWGEDKFYF